MDASWWSIPGPARFLEWVIQDLRYGKNVVLCLPRHYPEDLRVAVATRVRSSDLWIWRRIELESDHDDAVDPAGVVLRSLAPSQHLGTLLDMLTLPNEDHIAGMVIWVGNMTAPRWSSWQRFLAEYEQ